MDYSTFSRTLSRVRQGPSPAEIASWLGAGALGGVVDTMRWREEQARENARFEREMALREAYQKAQLEAMQGNQMRERIAFQREYGLDPDTGLPLYNYETTGPIPRTELLPPGAQWLVPPPAKPFQQPGFQTSPPPAVQMVKKPVVGLADRRLALQERAQENALAIADLERKLKEIELNDALDPETKKLRRDALLAEIDTRRAAAASSWANAAENKARAAMLGSTGPQKGKQAKMEQIMALYWKQFAAPPDLKAMDPKGEDWDPDTGLIKGAPTPEQWLRTWPKPFKEALGITEEDALEAQAPPLLTGHQRQESLPIRTPMKIDWSKYER